MGGLIANWKNYNDEVNSISRPFQMGPLWSQAHHVSGMPIHDLVWINDPPATSYPACVAVKCAAMQSRAAEEKFLRFTREAIMLNGLNIAKQNVLFDVAARVEKEIIDFNIGQFIVDFTSGAGTEVFKKDLQEVRYKNINRFPTLTVNNGNERGMMITGYRPYSDLYNVFKQLVNNLNFNSAINIDEYKNYYGSITQREIEEITPVQ